MGTDSVQGAQGVDLRALVPIVPSQIVDRCPHNQIWSSILRSAIGVNNDRSFSRKTFEDSSLYRLDDGFDGLRIVVRGQADENVDLTDIDELAKELICQKLLVRQFILPKK